MSVCQSLFWLWSSDARAECVRVPLCEKLTCLGVSLFNEGRRRATDTALPQRHPDHAHAPRYIDTLPAASPRSRDALPCPAAQSTPHASTPHLRYPPRLINAPRRAGHGARPGAVHTHAERPPARTLAPAPTITRRAPPTLRSLVVLPLHLSPEGFRFIVWDGEGEEAVASIEVEDRSVFWQCAVSGAGGGRVGRWGMCDTWRDQV